MSNPTDNNVHDKPTIPPVIELMQETNEGRIYDKSNYELVLELVENYNQLVTYLRSK